MAFSPKQKARMPAALVDYLLQTSTEEENLHESASANHIFQEEEIPKLEDYCENESCSMDPRSEETEREFWKFCKWGLHLPPEQEGRPLRELDTATISHILVRNLISTPQEISEEDSEIEGEASENCGGFPGNIPG